MAPPTAPTAITGVNNSNGEVLVSGIMDTGERFNDRDISTMPNTWLRSVCVFAGIKASASKNANLTNLRAHYGANDSGSDSGASNESNHSNDSVPTSTVPDSARNVPNETAPDPVDALTEALRNALASAMNPEQVRALVDDRVSEIVDRPHVTRVIVRRNDDDESEQDHSFRPHAQLQEVLDVLSIGANPYLMGPAGSGKTTLAGQVAESLGLPFFTLSGAPTPQDADLRGYQNISGVFMAPDFHRWATGGGVFLMDEFDAMYPGSQVWLNSATANRFASFPNGEGVVRFHDDALLIAAGNTNLGGATGTYSARNRADGATMDRFETIRVEYDAHLEDHMARATGYPGWADVVERMRRYRSNAEAAGIPIPITPRRTVSVCKLLQLGWESGRAWDTALWGRMDADTRVRVEG